MNKLWIALAGLVTVLAGLYYVWPTPFTFEQNGMVRVSRFTGVKEVHRTSGWAPVKEAGARQPHRDAVEKAYGSVETVDQGLSHVTLKNPTDWQITLSDEAYLKVTIPGQEAPVFDQPVSLETSDRFIEPGKEIKVRLSPRRGPRNPTDLSVKPEDAIGDKVRSLGATQASREVTFAVHTATHPDGRTYARDNPVVERKFSGEYPIAPAPAAPPA